MDNEKPNVKMASSTCIVSTQTVSDQPQTGYKGGAQGNPQRN